MNESKEDCVVYIIPYVDKRTCKLAFYIGQTSNPARREGEHARRGFLARCSFAWLPMDIVDACLSRADAVQRELEYKRSTHAAKRELYITCNNWLDRDDYHDSIVIAGRDMSLDRLVVTTNKGVTC